MIELIYGPHGGRLTEVASVPDEQVDDTVARLTAEGYRVSWCPISLPEGYEARSTGRATREAWESGVGRYIIIDVDDHASAFPLPPTRATELYSSILRILPSWEPALVGVLHTGGGVQIWLELDREATGKEISHVLAALQQDVASLRGRAAQKAKAHIDPTSFVLGHHQRCPGAENRKQGRTHRVYWLMPLMAAHDPLPVNALMYRSMAKSALQEQESRWRAKGTKAIQAIREMRKVARLRDFINLDKLQDHGTYSTCLCPIHAEDRPSFAVYHHDAGEIYFDAHDRRAYDIFSLLSTLWDMDFQATLTKIAERYDLIVVGVAIERQDEDLRRWLHDTLGVEVAECGIDVVDDVLHVRMPGRIIDQDKDVRIPMSIFRSPNRLTDWLMVHRRVLRVELEPEDLVRLGDIIAEEANESDRWETIYPVRDAIDQVMMDVTWQAMTSSAIPTVEDAMSGAVDNALIFLDADEPTMMYVSLERLGEKIRREGTSITKSDVAKYLKDHGWKPTRVRLSNRKQIRRWAITVGEWAHHNEWPYRSRAEAIAETEADATTALAEITRDEDVEDDDAFDF